MSYAKIAQQIAFLRHEVEETAAAVENLRRNGGVIPWESEANQKSTLQFLEERLQDERQLLADFEQLERITLASRHATGSSTLN